MSLLEFIRIQVVPMKLSLKLVPLVDTNFVVGMVVDCSRKVVGRGHTSAATDDIVSHSQLARAVVPPPFDVGEVVAGEVGCLGRRLGHPHCGTVLKERGRDKFGMLGQLGDDGGC